MTLLWLVTGAALAVALVAWRRARATARRLDQLTQMYWELRYQYGELRGRMERLDGGRLPTDAAGSEPPPNFVPLSSLKR